MAKNVGEKLVIGAGALGLLVLGCRALRLLWVSAVLVKKKHAKSDGDAPDE